MKQKGFTLIELLVALAVGGLVIMSAVSVIYQVVWGTSRTNSQVVALTDVHQAALRLKKDIIMAQSADFDLPDGSAVKLSWTDYTSFGDLEPEERIHASSYELLLDGKLQRTYDDGTPSIVGRNITYLDFTQDGRVINVVITATEGDVTPRSETLEFSVYLRTLGIE